MGSIRFWMTLGGGSEEQIVENLEEAKVAQAGWSRWRSVSGRMCDERKAVENNGGSRDVVQFRDKSQKLKC